MSDHPQKRDDEDAKSLSFKGAPDVGSIVAEDDAHIGVTKVELAEKVYGRYSKWALFISLGLASYIYSLDSSTTYNYLAFATSSFGEHSLISSIQVAQSMIIAVGKPVIAKVADVSSRGTAYLGVLIFYVVGYIVIASAKNVGTVAGGIVIYAVGYTGLQLLTQIIIADITTLKWRAFVSSIMSAPFLVNGFVGANIATSILTHSGWRWGYGMFAILVPATLSPLIIVLLWAENKAKKLGLVAAALQRKRDGTTLPEKLPLLRRTKKVIEDLDAVGLVLLGAAVTLILLPLTLSQTVHDKWRNGSIIAMIVVGCVLLPIFAIWDIKFAKRPVIPLSYLKNRAVVAASLIGFFDFVSFYLTFTYLYSFILIVKPWSLVNATYFVTTQTVALTFFGILCGIAMRYYQRYKYILVVGLCIRLLGVGLMIHSRGANAGTGELVMTQVLQGMGGGFAAVAIQVGAQASVKHADVAVVTAVVLLVTEIGGAVGTAIAGAIWSNTMPKNLAKHLPSLTQAARDTLYGSITSVAALPSGDPTREGVIEAYGETMRIMVIAATCLGVIPILLSLWMPDFFLGDTQNAIETESEETVENRRRF
ncbi:hypothetical protein PLICRDRAFT_173255 [Plicaturopsis crispa FD-325 SS-3]|nr:hypothetical protein PLICRDRAFT_173255 [Plicaturopsis crispa FD-325 SS-3]